METSPLLAGPEEASTVPRRDDERWVKVEKKMRELGYEADALIEVLHVAQEAFGYLDRAALAEVAGALGVPLSKAYGVATFYSYFSLAPLAEHTCAICTGTACYLDGAQALLAAASRALGGEAPDPLKPTTVKAVSLQNVRCLGPCSMSPVVVLDGEVRGNVSPEELASWLEAL